MTGIARYVQDPEIRKTLRETDGLGTEATRAGIIDLLFKRRFLVRQGKSIKATPTGRALIQALPATATTPDMTALWEQHLYRIAERQTSYQQFMGPLTEQLNGLIDGARQDSGPASAPCPRRRPEPTSAASPSARVRLLVALRLARVQAEVQAGARASERPKARRPDHWVSARKERA